jgi:hypothetical protein
MDEGVPNRNNAGISNYFPDDLVPNFFKHWSEKMDTLLRGSALIRSKRPFTRVDSFLKLSERDLKALGNSTYIAPRRVIVATLDPGQP